MFTKEAQALALATVEAIKKISKGKWEWEPEMGEFFLDDEGNLRLVALFDVGQIDDHEGFLHKPVKVIPILHWERIKKILEGMGYYLSVIGFEKEDSDEWETEDCQTYICVKNKKDKQYKEWYGYGKDPQISVMRAVIKLGKEK